MNRFAHVFLQALVAALLLALATCAVAGPGDEPGAPTATATCRSAVTGAVVPASACPGVDSSEAATVLAAADAYLALVVEHRPDAAAALGLEGGRSPNRWSDPDDGARVRRQRAEDRLLAGLEAVDTTRLAPDTAERRLRARLIEALRAARDLRVCRDHQWAVHPVDGIQVEVLAAALHQPVTTAEERRHLLERFSALPARLEAEREHLERGLASGRSAERAAVDAVVAQLDALLADPGPLGSPLDRLPASDDDLPSFVAAWRGVIDGPVRSALATHRRYLAEAYRERAREVPGLGALPDGERCYRARLRAATGLDLPPDEVFERGRRLRERVEARLVPLAERLFGTADTVDARRLARADRLDGDASVAAVAAAVERTHRVLPHWFDRVPAEPLAVTAAAAAPGAVEPFLAAGADPHTDPAAPSRYRPAVAPDRRARVVVDVDSSLGLPRMLATAAAARDGWPGHHLRAAAARPSPLHPVERLLASPAAIDGWALYAADLAEEMEVHGSDLERFGLLASLADAAAGLQVDVGIHTRGWGREAAVRFFMERAGHDRREAELHTTHHAFTPGRGAADLLGYLEIRGLRDQAEATLGPHLDLPAFHGHLLAAGPATLPVLGDTVDGWIGERWAMVQGLGHPERTLL